MNAPMLLDQWKIFLIPIMVVIITQVLKFFIHGIKTARWQWEQLGAYGGMPSTHTAIVISLLTMIGKEEGLASPLFGATLIFAMLTIRDAIGLRQFLSSHGRVLNELIRLLPDRQEKKFPHLIEIIGHRPGEALVGGMLGVFCTFLLTWIFQLG